MGLLLIESIKLLLFGYVVCIFLGCAGYIVFTIVFQIVFKALFFARKPIYSLKGRKKTLECIPDLDKALVNKRKILSYFSYDNRLLCLYKGPDKNGKLFIPEDIESIDEHAFDDFSVYDLSNGKTRLKENISAIVLPSTIKELDIDNIPRGAALIFADARLSSLWTDSTH